MDLYTFLKCLPKVSLHVHLAGTVQPSTLVELARKNGVALPAYREPADLYDYPDIYRFLKMLDLVMASVRDREDFHRITYETLQQAAEHGVRHREMFWNPTTHMACGVPYETAVDGIIAGIRDARHGFRHPVRPDRRHQPYGDARARSPDGADGPRASAGRGDRDRHGLC